MVDGRQPRGPDRSRRAVSTQHLLVASSYIVTHDQVEAMTMGERICIMNEGRIVQLGSPLEVYRNPANLFVAGFLASPPMNLMKATIDRNGSSAKLRCGALSLPVPDAYAEDRIPASDTPVVLGIRPEDIHENEIPGGFPVEVKIAAIEALGPETVVVGEIAGVGEISARIGRAFSAPIGSLQRLSLDLSQLHIFDAQTTSALRRKEA
jgi:ABC-type sugar transport system ATPase subunit